MSKMISFIQEDFTLQDLNLFHIFSDILSNNNIVGAISSSLLIILLGFYLTKKKIFSDIIAKNLSLTVLTVALPALSFNSFMQGIDDEKLMRGLTILIWGFIIQGALIFLMRLYYAKYKKDTQEVLTVLTTLGSTTFFGIPIIGAIYGAEGVLYASIFNISYRIYLYGWAFVSFSGLKMTRKNAKDIFLNPIIIATFAGILIWIFQAYLPQVDVNGEKVAIFRIDKTAFWLYQPMTYLAALASPLAWLSIGATLGQISLGEAITNKTAWFYTVTKVLLVPIFSTACLLILNLFIPISFLTVAVSAVMMATPPATVAVAYAIKFDKGAITASNCSLIATVIAVFVIPFLILSLEILKNMQLFT